MAITIDGQQISRLLRETWPTATMLAEELYAMLTALFLTAEAEGGSGFPVDIPVGDDSPAINYLGSPEDAVFLTMGIPDSEEESDLEDREDEEEAVELTRDGEEFNTADDATDDDRDLGERRRGYPLIGMAEIVSGEGSIYAVRIWVNNPNAYDDDTEAEEDGAILEVAARVMNTLEDDEVIEPGTFCLAVRVNGKYYLDIPVWQVDEADEGLEVGG